MKKRGLRRVLLADVARQAGVSVATASLALRGEGKMAPETRERVRQWAEKSSYRPNLAASMLARRREASVVDQIPVAVLGMGIKGRYAFPAPGFMPLFLKHAANRGFRVEEPELEEYKDVSKLLRVLYHRGVRGILLSHSFDTSSLTAEAVKPFSFLVHGQPFSKSPFHRVGTEVFEGTRLLWEAMWNRGYRRIGALLFRHAQDIQDDFAREAAVLNCQVRHDAPRLPSFTGRMADEAGLIRWVKETRPDAIMGFNGWQEVILRRAGFKIPEEVGFGALHVEEGEDLSGLYEDFEELGRRTVAQLDTMIRHHETGFPERPHQLMVAPVLREGKTLPLREPVKRSKTK